MWLLTWGYLSRHRTVITVLITLVVAAILVVLAIFVTWKNSLHSSLLIGVGSSMAAALVTTIISNSLADRLKKGIDRKFEAFFGRGSLARGVRGRIILQSDSMNTLMETLLKGQPDLFSHVNSALGQPENNRLFKARHWVNARDAESARIIRDKIRSFGYPTPQLSIVPPKKEKDPFKAYEAAPYVISMGLAFTKTSTHLAKLVDPDEKYFVIVENSEKGDALAVPHGFAHFDDKVFKTVEIPADKRPDGKTWQWLIPVGWELQEWYECAEMQKDYINDYAVIIRHRTREGRKQVRFLVAGFTEDTTIMAGKYLVEKWPYLWERFVKRNKQDFVLVIHADKKQWNKPIHVFPNPD